MIQRRKEILSSSSFTGQKSWLLINILFSSQECFLLFCSWIWREGLNEWVNLFFGSLVGKVVHSKSPVQLFPKSTGPTPVVVIWKGTVPGVVVGTCPHQWNCWDILPPCNHTAGTITDITFVPCAMDVQHLKDYSSSEGGKILWRSWQRGFKIWNWSDRSKWACDTWRTDTV